MESFWSMVDKSGDCWLWKGATNNGGYGLSSLKGVNTTAHRKSFIISNPDINITGLDIDHLCRNRLCVKPSHLEAVSHAENCRRGNGFSGINSRKTHCKNGHEFNSENTIIEKLGRKCRLCNLERVKKKSKEKYWADPELGRLISRNKNRKRRSRYDNKDA